MKISRRSFSKGLVGSICGFSCSSSFAAAVADDPTIKELLKPVLAKYDLPALSAAIVTSQGLKKAAVVGVRKSRTNVEATIDDLWHLGSDTKAMTASLMAMLVEERKLQWSDSLAGVLPEISELRNSLLGKVMVKQLLHHSAGLKKDAIDWWAFAKKGGSVRKQRLEVLREAARTPLSHDPFLYSNVGYVLAGSVIEKLSGMDWEHMMRDRLFKPLNMTTAGFGGVGTLGKMDQPWPHGANGMPMPQNGPLTDNAQVMGPAATVHASLNDWAIFIADHLKGARGESALLKPESYKALHTPEPLDYAKGWLVAQRPWAGGTVLTHSGDNSMNHCTVWIAPAKGFATLVCTNRGAQEKAADEVTGLLIQECLKM